MRELRRVAPRDGVSGKVKNVESWGHAFYRDVCCFDSDDRLLVVIEIGDYAGLSLSPGEPG
jgi:hypothetical protein